MNSSRNKILFWCLIAVEAAGSQVILWNGLPIYRRLLSRLYSGEFDALEILKLKEVADQLEEAADAFEHLANVVETIAAKES